LVGIRESPINNNNLLNNNQVEIPTDLLNPFNVNIALGNIDAIVTIQDEMIKIINLFNILGIDQVNFHYEHLRHILHLPALGIDVYIDYFHLL